jgi:riboflavin biosynthesis pyrimidine reductase
MPSMQVVVGEHPAPGPLPVERLSEAYPWPDQPMWLRAMMVMTLDGAVAGPDGRSRSISSVGDRAVLAAVRRFSDVVLIGAGTFRAERYGPMRARSEDAASRAEQGLAPAPVLAIVSGSLHLPWDEPVFTESAARPIVITAGSADPAAVTQARQRADLITLPGALAEPPAVLGALAEHGLGRVVCEGGQKVLAGFATNGLIDETDLSISPLMIGGGQVSTGPAIGSPHRFALAQLIVDDDGFAFHRYVAERASADPGEDEP